MIEKTSRRWRNAALVVLAAALCWFLWTIRSVLNPLILGYLLAYVAHPSVLKLERRGLSRRSAVNVIFVGAGLATALVLVFGFLQGRSLVLRFSDPALYEDTWERLGEEVEQHAGLVSWVTDRLPGAHPADGAAEPAAADGAGAAEEPAEEVAQEDAEVAEVADHGEAGEAGEAGAAAASSGPRTVLGDLRAAVEEWTRALFDEENMSSTRDKGLALAGGLLAFLQRLFGSILGVGTALVLLPIYTYFLLFELERIHAFVRHYLPAGERTRLSRVGKQIGEVLSNFFRGRLLVCLLKGLCYTLGLWIAGIDYALLIGLGTGFLSLVPFVGSIAGAVLACLVAFLSHDLAGALWRVGIVFVAVELLENYVLVPKILGDTLALHPLVVIFAIMAGGAAFGMFGLLLALPLTAALVILTREFVLPMLEQIARGEGRQRPA